MKRLPIFLAISLLIPLFISCSSQPAAEEEAENMSNAVVISQAQFKQAGMRVGDPEQKEFETFLTTSAVVSLPADGHARISCPVAGTVSRIHHKAGDLVKRGSVIFSIRSMEGIALQQEYAETVARFRVIRENYDRQKLLMQENVTSRKEFLTLEGEYKSMLGKAEGLRARLKLLNIDPAGAEDGKILDEIPVTAAIDGYISRMEAVSGQFLSPGTEIVEQVNSAKYQLILKVFGQDLGKLKPGQEVSLVAGGDASSPVAVLKTIGKSMDPETKTIDCIAQIQGDGDGSLVLGMVHNVRVRLSTHQGLAVPESALIKSGQDYYVLVKESESGESITLNRVKVSQGLTRGGFTEILNPQNLKNVLLTGVSDIALE